MKITISYIRSGRFFIQLTTGFKTTPDEKKATRFENLKAASTWLRSEGINSEYVSFNEV